MKNAKMRFCGYAFEHNPAKLMIADAARIRALLPPGSLPDSISLGRGLRIVKGEGELAGADCLARYERLRALYERGEKGILALPGLKAMTACLSALSLTAEPTEDVIGYRFTFTEARGDGAAVSGADTYTVRADGESLWDIAYAYGIGIDELVRLNPQIALIGSLSENERVRLC
jgi:hypothetical protein